MVNHEEGQKSAIFPIGEKNREYADYFIGQSYLNSLVADPNITVGVSNVTFEPGCRNNWHKHHDGFQVLLVTSGEGWYQEEDQAPQFLQTGDVVVIHDGIKHWHGATKNSWFSHISMTAGKAEWLEPVSNELYAKCDHIYLS